MQSLWTGLTALNSASNWLSQVSDNLANTNTVGFAADGGSFADTLTTALQGSATAPNVAGRTTPLGWWGGTGVMSGANHKDFSTLPVKTTGNAMDASITGAGFFAVQGPSSVYLTKAGNFTWSRQANGTFALALPNGMPVLDTFGQRILEPSNHAAMNIGQDGQVSFGTTKGPQLAVLEVADPASSLQSVGDNLFAVQSTYRPFPSTTSTVQQGALSMSNVDLTAQMTDMIQAQQMYNLNAESVSMTNKMMGIANGLRG